MSKINSESLTQKSAELFDYMISRSESITRTEAIEFLGPTWGEHYVLLAKALQATGKIILKRGVGGIQYNPRKRSERSIVTSNLSIIKSYIEANFDPELEEAAKKLGSEKLLYGPLSDYLLENDVFPFVQIHGDDRSGKGVWKNPDLICLRINESLHFSLGVYPKVTGIEVKEFFPGIKELQQARSYLTFCHSSYICFYHPEYTGKDYDYLVDSLRQADVWDQCNAFELGIIVAYKPTVRSTQIYFHIAREAPEKHLAPEVIDATVFKYFSTNVQIGIKKALKEQIKRIID